MPWLRPRIRANRRQVTLFAYTHDIAYAYALRCNCIHNHKTCGKHIDNVRPVMCPPTFRATDPCFANGNLFTQKVTSTHSTGGF